MSCTLTTGTPAGIRIRAGWDSYTPSEALIHQLIQRRHLPLPRNPPERRVLKQLRVPVRVAELAVLVEAAGEEVVEQPRLDLLQLRNDRLGVADRLVYGVEDLGDPALLLQRGYGDGDAREDPPCEISSNVLPLESRRMAGARCG